MGQNQSLKLGESVPSWQLHVIDYLDWEQRDTVLVICKKFCNYLLTNDRFWKIMCKRLEEENKLYITRHINSFAVNWRSIFEELWRIRYRFVTDPKVIDNNVNVTNNEGEEEQEAVATGSQQALLNETHKFSIGVVARFRPGVDSAGGEQLQGKKVVIPFHQRVALIQMKYPNASRKEALLLSMKEMGKKTTASAWGDCEVLVKEKTVEPNNLNLPGGESSPDITTQASNAEGAGEGEGVGNEDINVGSDGTIQEKESTDNGEIKPTNQFAHAGVLSISEEEASILTIAPGVGLRRFEFNKVVDVKTKQRHVYEENCSKIIMDFLNGYNASILVFGQTGSGKTFTMFGPAKSAALNTEHAGIINNAGIVPRTCVEIFDAVAKRKKAGSEVNLAVSYVEIFGNSVVNLLKERQIVGQSSINGNRYVLDGHAEEHVENMGDIMNALKRGEEQKKFAATAMNDYSSRAHTLFVVTLTQECPVSGNSIKSKLFLADLGGSEKLTKSKVHENTVSSWAHESWSQYYEQRKNLQEAVNINTGLFALKRCIHALNEREKAIKEGRRPPYVPYQESKLTMLLSTALGGFSKTMVILTLSKEPQNAIETVQTLRFGEQCSNIENTGNMATNMIVSAIKKLDNEIEEMEELIRKNERWETKRVIRKDARGIYDDLIQGVGAERLNTTVLVGAEKERELLEKLLEKRRIILGEVKDTEDEKEMKNEQGIKKQVDDGNILKQEEEQQQIQSVI